MRCRSLWNTPMKFFNTEQIWFVKAPTRVYNVKDASKISSPQHLVFLCQLQIYT